jgi:predicted PurR-regulated permease PerM
MFAPVLAPLATAGLVFVVAIFILLQQGDLRDRLIRLIGSSDLYRTTTAMDDAATRLSRYFLSQVGVNAAFTVFRDLKRAETLSSSHALYRLRG